VSKIKTPREKKLASLANDRRNTYGENSKSSRKNISLSKQLSHKATRRASQQTLQEVIRASDEDEIVNVEAIHRSKTTEMERKAFQKWPDGSLQDVLRKKETGKFVSRLPSQGTKP
jgi:hypothetical protein